MKNELSERYKLGFKTGFKVAVLSVMNHSDDHRLVDNLIEDYNKYPLIDELSVKDIKSK